MELAAPSGSHPWVCSLLSSTRPPGAAALGAPSRWWQQKSCRDASSLLCPCSPSTVAAGRMLSPSKRLQPVATGPLLPVPCGSCAASRADPCCQPRSLPVPARLAQGEQPSPSPRAREARLAEQVFTDTFFLSIYLFIFCNGSMPADLELLSAEGAQLPACSIGAARGAQPLTSTALPAEGQLSPGCSCWGGLGSAQGAQHQPGQALVTSLPSGCVLVQAAWGLRPLINMARALLLSCPAPLFFLGPAPGIKRQLSRGRCMCGAGEAIGDSGMEGGEHR